MHQLPESPALHLLTTNISEGGLCSFTRDGLIMQHRSSRGTKVDTLPARLTRISLAVTASSARRPDAPAFAEAVEVFTLPRGASNYLVTFHVKH